MRLVLATLFVSVALSTASIAIFKAIVDHADRVEALEARDQMNRVAFSSRYAPRDR